MTLLVRTAGDNQLFSGKGSHKSRIKQAVTIYCRHTEIMLNRLRRGFKLESSTPCRSLIHWYRLHGTIGLRNQSALGPGQYVRDSVLS